MKAVGFNFFDHHSMQRALELAALGLFTTTPNPRVGCVIAHAEIIVGEGWHERAGAAHAEVRALDQAGSKAKGGCAYVTLEPCSHFGRTPPCADALIAAGLTRVVIARQDPNPLVAGSGIARLRAAGITVEVGLGAESAFELNPGFFKRMRRGLPWVRAKVAMSLDGRSALANGQSQWITGVQARADGHRWRARSCAVATGMGTVRHDDPALTVRECPTSRQPVRVVLDSRLTMPLGARILQSAAPTWLATCVTEPERARPYQQLGAEVLPLPRAVTGGGVDLGAWLAALGQRGLNEVTVEAGPHLTGALLHGGWLDELVLYLAPCILGAGARGAIEVPDLTDLAQRHALEIHSLLALGADWRIVARPISREEACLPAS